ncbi:MAG TPA: protein phosphatase 2C domain-containing protein [Anaerolineales bacterium]|nr:protein phosphatase 2C domain-containing protein [Anaerolineales bacterium]
MRAMDAAKLIIYGKEHETPGKVYGRDLAPLDIGLGTSVGVATKPNEDCVGAAALGSELILAIADGHWGRDASEMAVSKAVQLLRGDARPSKDSETRARLFALFDQVNTELYRLATSAPGASASETTLIVCHVKETPLGKYLYWSSFGDSYLFALRNKELKQLNTLNPFWLGYLSKLSENAKTGSILTRFLSDEARYVGVANGLETGIELLQSDDLIFLCTDGLVGSDREPEPAILTAITEVLVSDMSLSSKVEQVIASALRRDETDNISCVLALVNS